MTDLHCFSFAPLQTLTRRSLANIFLSGGPTVKGFRGEVRSGDLRNSVAYKRMMRELSLLMGVRGNDEAVLRSRSRAAQDFPRYLGTIFGDAKIGRAAVDNGIEPVSFEEFRRYMPIKLHRIFRIEPLLKKLFESTKTFPELSRSFDESMRTAVREQGFVGFKSVTAYRTGLDVKQVSETEALRTFREYKNGDYESEWFGPRLKPVRDFFLCRTAELSAKLGSFIQIHTGVGDTDIIADKCDPLLLKDFLKTEAVSKVPIILIHGGFPFTKQAAWLANVFPNVYFELSTPLPPIFIPALSRGRYREVLEMVPATRIVYGSDAIEIPENHCISAKLAKRALGEALGELIAEKVLGDEEAHRFARLILKDNADRLLSDS